MYIHRGLLLVFLVMYIFSPTIQEWIKNDHAAWYRPFLAWGMVIYLAHKSQGRLLWKDPHV